MINVIKKTFSSPADPSKLWQHSLLLLTLIILGGKFSIAETNSFLSFSDFLRIRSSMEYVKTLVPGSLVRSVTSVGTSFTGQVLPPPKPRPFRICTYNRCRRRGVVAASLDDLASKVVNIFLLTSELLTLVLEEDGTVVDTEAFFQSLPANTPLMVLEKGQRWTQSKGIPGFQRLKKSGIAKLSFDLYKLNPKDFIGCLAIQATLYEMYSFSYEIQCMGLKVILKSILQCLTYVAQVSGHFLLCGSTYLLQHIEDDD
ncbi:lipid transferase CIDEA [Paramormyrops kingsleyae]|uniref:Cell death inducing DFFA like effector a n=1 Tax=Paramormyrops kingsleyae TaxID=1676925 RepID=A0A3B3SF24_9TELE|nr:cell death activator CIDE-A-like isoform X2 [Paramormyrops kingsleyae]